MLVFVISVQDTFKKKCSFMGENLQHGIRFHVAALWHLESLLQLSQDVCAEMTVAEMVKCFVLNTEKQSLTVS